MNLSRKVSKMIKKVSEELSPIDTPPDKSNDEKLVSLLECVGLAEGFNFCYDEGEILIPDEVEINPNRNIMKSKSVKLAKCPNVSFDTSGKDIVATFKDMEENQQSVLVPLYVYQLLLHYTD